jgi:3-hydroxymyristoyl/3-hydroxydecanoyl-(acyl carrier protein) dehydratase
VDINVGGYAKVGPVRLFFFNSHGWVNGELASAVRNGQTGFFTNKELRSSGGILWNPANAKPREIGRLDPPAVVHGKRAFSADEVRAFSEDRAVDCFGPLYAETLNHTRTPRIQRGLMQLIDEITEFDPEGGPWGRGYICAVKYLTDEEWFYDGHFKGDPCMPGTLTIEAIAQLGMFYAAAMGYTVGRDGWRFEPLLGELSHVRARGQTVPGARKVVYELFIEGVSTTPVPTMHAQGLSTVDGLRAFHGGSSGGQLIPGYPIESRVRLLPKESDTRAARWDGRSLDLAHLLHFAWGRPSDALGERYAVFDGARQGERLRECPRLPGPPLLLLSRIASLEAIEQGIAAECDVLPNAWFAQEQHARLLSPWVLLEAARQAGIWWLSARGIPLEHDEDVMIRLSEASLQMDGPLAYPQRDSRLRVELRPPSSSDVTGTSLQAVLFLDGVQVASLDVRFEVHTKPEREGAGVASVESIWLGEGEQCRQTPLLPQGMLQMLDGVPEYWPEGGEAGLGALRASKEMSHGSWYFTCNAFQDPHLPSSMLLEMACQAIACLAAQKGVVSPQGCWAAFGASIRLDQYATIRPGTGELSCRAEVVAMAGGAIEGLARFYLAGHLVATVSGVAIRPLAAAVADGTIHPDAEPLADYVPAFGVAMTSPGDLVERMAAAAVSRLPGRVIVRMGYARFAKEDLWLSDQGISYAISCRMTGPNRLLVAMRKLRDGACGEALAEASFEFAEEFPLGPRAVPPLQEGEPQGNPYESGLFEAGPSWQVITELVLGGDGASAVLDPTHASPGAALHPAFIEAALQTLLPRNGRFWSALPLEGALRPAAIEAAEFFRPPKRLMGPVRLESRLESIADGKVYTRHTFIHDNRTCAQFKAVFALTEPTPWDRLPRSAKRALVSGKGFDPGMLHTSTDEKGQTVVPAELASAPEGLWRVLYGLSADEDLCLGVALREHVARLAHGHPRWVHIAEEGGVLTAESETTPGLRYALLVKKSRNKRLIANAELPKVKLDEGITLLRERWGISERWLCEDLFRGLIGRFGGSIIAEDPKGLAALSGRGVLYLANHQLDLESILFVVAMTVVTGSTTQVMVRDEARDSYFGCLFFLLAGRGDLRDPKLFALVQRQDIAGMWRAFQAYLDKVRDEKMSFLVHVEGAHKERAREPVGRVSAALVDSAVERGIPIVPVRFAGSLPIEPLGAHPEFPSALGPGHAIMGSPIMAEDLLRYPSKARCEMVCRAINTLGEPYDRLEDERPSAGEPAWVAAVERRQVEAQVSREQAVVYCLLKDLPDPSEEAKQALALAEGRLKREDVPPWLADFATVILGCRV